MRTNENNTAALLTTELDSNIFEIKDLENPAELMHTVLDDVSHAFDTLQENFDFSYEQFSKYVQFHNSDLSQQLDELWDKVNSNIYDHYEQGVLLSFELKEWKSLLIEWKEKIMAAIVDLVKAEFNQNFVSGKAQPVYVEAA